MKEICGRYQIKNQENRVHGVDMYEDGFGHWKGGAEEVNIDLKSEPKTKNKQKMGGRKWKRGRMA